MDEASCEDSVLLAWSVGPDGLQSSALGSVSETVCDQDETSQTFVPACYQCVFSLPPLLNATFKLLDKLYPEKSGF